MQEETTPCLEEKELRLWKEVLIRIESVKSDTSHTKEHQSKSNLIVLAIVFFAGMIFGIQTKTWTPAVDEVYKAFSVVKDLKGQ